MKTDVSNRLDVHNLIAATVEAFSDIHILVNNAAVVHSAPFLDLKEEDFDRVIRINLKGSFLAGQAVARYLVEKVQNGGAPGSIVNMSSINAKVTIATEVPYSVSKGGIGQLTKVMALALAPHGIRVNAIGPGSIMTDMLTATNADEEARAAPAVAHAAGTHRRTCGNCCHRGIPGIRPGELHHRPDHLC